MADINTEKTQVKTKKTSENFIVAVGRRKEAAAGVRLYDKEVSLGDIKISKGEIIVNSKKAEEYFGKSMEVSYKEPLRITNTENAFAITVRVRGGGKAGQMDAMVLGLARALDKYDRKKYHDLLKQKGFFTRDSRVRQRRKVGMSGKSRRRKQSPKR